MIRLGVNIDHVATLRQARYRQHSGASAPEPDPLLAARICMAAGAHSLTVHLREDRRHIQDDDVLRIAREFRDRLNLEMAATPAMVDFALRLKPSEVCLVPENRAEVTTEGGLDAAGMEKALQPVVQNCGRRASSSAFSSILILGRSRLPVPCRLRWSSCIPENLRMPGPAPAKPNSSAWKKPPNWRMA